VLYEAHTVPSSCLLLHSHDGSICEYIFTLIEGSRLSTSAVGGWYGLVSRSPRKSMAMEYDMNVQVRRCRVTGLWCISIPAHDVAVVAEGQRNPFISARLLLIFLGRNMYSCFEI
jgi:hypothetical protein